jgi:hypothetical protein
MIDWDQMAAAPIRVRFAAMRLGISWGYTDKWFSRNWRESRRVEVDRIAYHVLYPGEAVKPQIDLVAKNLDGDMGELPFVADMELQHGLSPAKIQTAAYEYINRLADLTKRMPIGYSRTEWIDRCLIGAGNTPPDWLNDLDWWLALYLSSGKPHPGPVTAPRGVSASRILFHQVADHTPSLGFGINQLDSKQLDYDRFLGTEAQYQALTNRAEPQPDRQALVDWVGNQLYLTAARYQEDEARNRQLSTLIETV